MEPVDRESRVPLPRLVSIYTKKKVRRVHAQGAGALADLQRVPGRLNQGSPV